MKMGKMSLPPDPPMRRQQATIVLRAMVVRTWFAYGALAIATGVLAPQVLRASTRGIPLNTAFVVVEMAGAYLSIGGILCGALISQLRRWPPPGPDVAVRVDFVWSWPWTAIKLIAYLATREPNRGT